MWQFPVVTPFKGVMHIGDEELINGQRWFNANVLGTTLTWGPVIITENNCNVLEAYLVPFQTHMIETEF